MSGKKETFLLVSLSEDKAKELAQVVSNDTCRRILDSLAEGDATESQLASKLSIPISTVHYNLQQLMKGGLVVVEEFHYSEKGKEVNHYKLANKYIIIAPQKTWGLKEKLKKILPSFGLVLGGAAVLQLVSTFFSRTEEMAFASKAAVFENAPKAIMSVADAAASTGAANETMTGAARTTVEVIQQTSIWQHAAVWFLIGGCFAILIYLIVDWRKEKR